MRAATAWLLRGLPNSTWPKTMRAPGEATGMMLEIAIEGAHNSTARVYTACVTHSREDRSTDRLQFRGGAIRRRRGPCRQRSLAARAGHREGSLSAEGGIEYGDLHKKYVQSTSGAHFVEVSVDAATAEMRVRRKLAVCAAGRILNPRRPAASDWRDDHGRRPGPGGRARRHKRSGFFVNHDLPSCEVPVNEDIPHQDMIFLDETDPASSRMKAKGVAELGICGVAAVVATRSTTRPG
jgi:xanthine dehydrogenase YagR molybdenum-binding subunit